MKTMLASTALTAVMVALAAWAGGDLARGEEAAQDAVSIGVDADPTGNTATSLGPVDSCRSVSTGDTFEVDVFVTEVSDLLAWETYFAYDMSVINIVSRDVMMFQASNTGSRVFDVSEALPDIDGRYGVAAADIAEPPAPDSGSGVLARLTLEAVGPGISPASLSPIDVNGDGTMDLGPFLAASGGEPIGDQDEDGFFDGPISNAQIAVDSACPGGTPVASPALPGASPSPVAETPGISATPETPVAPTPVATVTPQPDGTSVADSGPAGNEGSPWTGTGAVVGYILGGVAALLLASIGLLGISRIRAR